MRRRLTAYRGACAALVVLLAVVVGANGFGNFYTDIKPEVYLAPWDTLGRYLSGWTSSPYLGSPNFNVGLAPVLVVLSALRGIGLSPEWAFKVFHFGLWLLAAVGANRFLRALVPSAGKWAGLAAGVFYVANPYQIVGGSTLAILLPMALLPWMLLCFVRGLHQPRGWAWPALFGLTFFAMSGMNVAVVPILQLLALLPILVFARLQWRLRLADLALVTGKCALWVVALSIYWLVPARAALTTGRQIVLQSETLDGIAKVSSYPEVLRGMGMWSLYGSDANGPWIPQFAVYFISTVVMVATILWPALALLAMTRLRGAARGILVGISAIAVVIAVGMFPHPDHPSSLFGMLLRELLGTSAASAFRTTNKIGALIALAFALALAMGAQWAAHRVKDLPGVPAVATALVAVLVAAWCLPALTNRLYTSQMNVPDYWKAAAKTADEGDPDSRVLFLPGQVRPSYRWTAERPDDVANSLLRRDAVLPETSPNASAPGGNYLAALTDTLESGVVPPAAMSTYARYLGIDRILLRHDTRWEPDGGSRPSENDRIVSADPGLFGYGNYGNPGEFTYGLGTDAAWHGEQMLHPVQVYDVRDPLTAVRARSDADSLVVAGDAWSIPQMLDAGLLRTTPNLRYAESLDADSLRPQLGARHGLVLTDTNARREAIPNRLSNGNGSLLAADEELKAGRALGTSDDQTVLVRSGAQVTASDRGGAFFDLPYADPANILDGDPATAWRFGDFGRAVGQTATISQPSPVRLGTIKVSQTKIGSVMIDRVTITAGGRTITRKLPDEGSASFDFGDTRADEVSLRIDSTRGEGFNLVGIREVEMPGAKAIRTARTPMTLSNLYQDLSTADRAKFAKTPLTVALSRLQGTTSPSDDTETRLRRIVSLPDDRTFEVSGKVRFEGDVETAYDRSAGYADAVKATSSSFYFDNPINRASQAADGKRGTSWVPGGGADDPVRNQWWQVTTPERDISSVKVTQTIGYANADDTVYATSATVTVDGRKVAEKDLTERGTTTISFPKTRGKTVRVTFDAPLESGPPARFSEIDTGVKVRETQRGPLDDPESKTRCLNVGTVDGQPLRMKWDDDTIAGPRSQGTRWIGCDPLELGAGDHRIEDADGFVIDSLTLDDEQRKASSVPTQPTVDITKNSASAASMKVRAQGAFNVVLGQSYDERWVATANGKDLGEPVVLDGYSTGWRVPKGGTYDIDIRYAPQRGANIALLVSLVAFFAAVFIAFRAHRSRELHAAPTVELDDTRGADVPHVALEVALVAVAGFFVGWAGLVAAAAVVVADRTRRARPWWLVATGSALIVASIPVYLVVQGDYRGTVAADAVATSLWPHRLAGAGFVLALAALLVMARRDREDVDGPHAAVVRAGHDRTTRRRHPGQRRAEDRVDNEGVSTSGEETGDDADGDAPQEDEKNE